MCDLIFIKIGGPHKMILRAKTKNEFNPLLQLGMAAQSTLAIGNRVIIVGKGVYTPPFLRFSPS